jgi:hypothetical protein
MEFGSGFAPAVFGPVQAVGHQLDGGRVHDVNEALEAEGQLRATPRAKAGMKLLEMVEHRPEQRLGHFRVTFPVGVREGVFAGRGRAADRRQRTRVQPQGVADVVKAEAVGELGVDQADDMAPRTKRAAPFLHRMFAGQLRHQMIGNQIAKLSQKRELCRRWLALSLVFHALPCGRVQTRKPTLSYPSTIKPVGQLCNFLLTHNYNISLTSLEAVMAPKSNRKHAHNQFAYHLEKPWCHRDYRQNCRRPPDS